jgi:hypothetical protein
MTVSYRHGRRERRGTLTRGPAVVIDRRPGRGPGDALHAAIEGLGLRVERGCACRSKIAEMNQRGADWCVANVDTIVGWLADEAKRRRLPFVRRFAAWFVRRALKQYEDSLP